MAKRLQRGLLVIAGLILVGVLVIPVGAQDGTGDTVNTALKQAASFLSKQIGKPITSVENYTYSLETYPDAGLGCPEPSKTYPASPVQAYKFLISFGGITYDVRTTLDGSRSVLCNGADIKQMATLAVYRSPLFSIAYPERWSVIDRVSDIYFGLGPTPICSQPGMTVTALGAVPSTKTPDKLLDEYAQNTPNSKFETERLPIGNIGRSVLYVSPCVDGSPRAARATVFVAYGRGYRVVQFAPQSAFNQWADIYLKILAQFSPGVTGAAGNTGGVSIRQPDMSPPVALVHIFAGNVYIGTLADLPGTAITSDAASDHQYRTAVLSPAGDTVAFIDPSSGSLYVAPTNGETPRKVAEKLAPGYPAAWSPDGREIAYLGDEGVKEGGRAVYSFMAAKVDGSGSRQIGSAQGLRTGCSASATDPAEQLYWSEMGIGGNDLWMAWLRNGTIYYSLGCDGIGVGSITDNGATRGTLHENLRRVRVSPDGSELLGIIGKEGEAPTLVRLRIQDGTVTPIKTAAPPDQAAWSLDAKSVYYSTVTLKDTITLDDETLRERGLKAFGVWPFRTVVYDVALHRLDLAGGEDTVLYQADGRAIGHIAPSPDGSGVLFVFVESASNFVDAFRNNVSTGDLRRQAPDTPLYWLSFATGQVQLLAITNRPTWGPLGSAALPTPTGNPAKPPTLKPSTRIPAVIPPTNTRLPNATP
ncbi:MAG: hypothetical protein IT324_28965 [Anaerolineae bacterium]|nr:hypothetical protein [Anaerolineae bacterium]